jgi:hypothetical protein
MTGLKMLGDMSGPVLQSLPMMRNQALGRAAYEGQMESLNKEIQFLNENGKSDVVLKYNRGINPETNQIDLAARDAIFEAAKPLRIQEQQSKMGPRIAGYAKLGKETVQAMIDSGQIESSIAPQALLAAETFEKSKQPVVAKNTDLFVEAARAKAKASGSELSPVQEADLRKTFIAGGGRLKPLEAKTSTKLEDEFAVMETIDNLQDGIAAFEKQYPGKKFTDFLGAIPTTETKIRSLIETEKDPMKQEALGLLADFMGVVNRTARTTSGLNVTESEGKRIAQEIGSAFDKNSLIKLDRYRQRIERSARGTISRNIDKALPSFYERWSTTPFGTRTTAAYSAPGVSFQSTTQSTEGMSNEDLANLIQQLQQKSAQQ